MSRQMTLEHDRAVDAVLALVREVAANPGISEDGLVQRLMDGGYSQVDAERLNAFVPSAFAWVVLHQLGASLPSKIALPARNAVRYVPIESEHFLTAALCVAHDIFQHGWKPPITRSVYETIANRSAEMDATNKVFEEGGNLADSTIEPTRYHRLAAVYDR